MNSNRTIIMAFMVLVSLAGASAAEVPSLINYQGRMLDHNGNLISSNVMVSVGIYTNPTLGEAVYSEEIGTVAVNNGIYSFMFGTNEAEIANVFKNPDTWLEVSVNGTTVTPRQRLVAVPYAIRSGEADLPFIGRGTNNVVTRFEEIDATRPPVGAVVAWLKDMPGVSTNLPVGWVECNGQTLSDAESPLDGQLIPNLNGASGGVQRFLSGGTSSGGTGGTNTISLSHQVTTVNQRDWDVVGPDESYAAHNFDNRPPFYEVVWIIRVK